MGRKLRKRVLVAIRWVYNTLQSKRARTGWNAVCIISALCFFAIGIYYLPFSGFPNGFNAPVIGQWGYAQFAINYKTNSTEYTALANLTIFLSPQAQIVGSHGIIQPTLEISPSVASTLGIQTIIVRPQEAFVYKGLGKLLQTYSTPCPDNPSSTCIASVYGPLFNEIKLERNSQNPIIWGYQQDVDFTAPGSYGVSMDIVARNATYKFEASNVYTIYSADFVTVRHNEALTMSLTAFVLMFAAIEARSKD